MFERLRAAINAAIDAATPPPDARELVSAMREAVIEARAAIEGLRDGVEQTERRLAAERKQLEDAERRGRMAAGIDDEETVEVAQRFSAKHQEHVAMLEGKLQAQRAELSLAERQLEGMKAQLRKVAGSRHVEAAWREIETAGGTRPETDFKNELLRSQIDSAAREAEAEARLEALKKKMGK